jgi:hypothetical protein
LQPEPLEQAAPTIVELSGMGVVSGIGCSVLLLPVTSNVGPSWALKWAQPNATSPIAEKYVKVFPKGLHIVFFLNAIVLRIESGESRRRARTWPH